jgi:hypothetical protein
MLKSSSANVCGKCITAIKPRCSNTACLPHAHTCSPKKFFSLFKLSWRTGVWNLYGNNTTEDKEMKITDNTISLCKIIGLALRSTVQHQMTKTPMSKAHCLYVVTWFFCNAAFTATKMWTWNIRHCSYQITAGKRLSKTRPRKILILSWKVLHKM